MAYHTTTGNAEENSLSMNHDGANLRALYKNIVAAMFSIFPQIYMKGQK